TLIDYLKEQNLKLNDKKHYDILRKLPGRPIIKLAKEIKALKEKSK
ncbi:2904_t:CDS:1, partial [Funneliformis caledonium]